MASIYRAVAERVVVRLLQSREQESEILRKYFRKRYDIEVGLYSFGAFDRTRIGPGTVVGRYCSIAGTVRIITENHPIQSITTHPVSYTHEDGGTDRQIVGPGKLKIEDDVWIGSLAIVTPGVNHIGRGAIIGAGSVVTKDVLPYSVVGGNPSRQIRLRFDEATIEAIEASRWWEFDRKELRRRLRLLPSIARSASLESVIEFQNL